jgi:hypothetical protein
MPAEAIRPREMEGPAIRQKLKELLSSRGTNAPKGGDYDVVEQDSGTYEQKVLMFHDRVLDEETIKVVSKMLEDYSMDWSIHFLKANEDGTEADPQVGMEVCSYDLVMDIRPRFTPQELRDWETTEELYEVLAPMFAACGVAYKDYWLWDDKWVPLTHRIHINNVEYLTPGLVEEVQHLLTRGFSNCVVWMQIDAEAPGIDVPCEGIIVHADRIEEHWNCDTLRAIFKDRFKF